MGEQEEVIDKPAAQPATKEPTIPVMAPIHAADAQAAAAGPPVMTVMEIDPASSPEQQALDLAEANEKGLQVIMKGQAPPGMVPVSAAKPGAQQDAAKKEEPADDEEPVHPLLKLLGGSGEPEVELPEPPPAVAEYFKAAGLDEDPRKFLKEARTATIEVQNLRKQNEEHESRFAVLDQLSPAAQNVLAKDIAGEDWRSQMRQQPDFKYEEPYSRQNQRKVTDAFSGIALTNEDWEEYGSPDGDPTKKRIVQAAIDIAKPKFEEARKAELEYGQNAIKQAQEIEQKQRASRDASIALLNKIPGAAPYVSKVKSMLTREGILSLFFEKDGVTFKPTASFDAWMVSDRDAVLGATNAVQGARAKNIAALSVMRRTEERVVPGAKGSGKQELTAEQAAKLIFERGLQPR